jgi:hypothetical protein
MARLAKSLITLRDQVNAKWVGRSKASDGWIGDTKHAARRSDHNPFHGVVHAVDITHDPKNGFNSYKFGDAILAQQDPRLDYVISNGRIGYGPAGKRPGVWQKYNGSNPHDHHVHISCVDPPKLADDTRPWGVGEMPVVTLKPELPAALPQLREGTKNAQVGFLQRLLKIDDDDDFGPKTKKAVIAAQKLKGLKPADGIAGPQFWKAFGVTEIPPA